MNFLTFFQDTDNEVLIFGHDSRKVHSFNIEQNAITYVDNLDSEDYFFYIHSGIEYNKKIYMLGSRHIHTFDLDTNEIDIIEDSGLEDSEIE